MELHTKEPSCSSLPLILLSSTEGENELKKIAVVCLAIIGLLAPQVSSAEESAKLISTATFPDITINIA